jgi:hypothetical protein
MWKQAFPVYPRLSVMGRRNFDIAKLLDENGVRDLQNTKLGWRLASEMTNATTHSKLRAKNLIILIKLKQKMDTDRD